MFFKIIKMEITLSFEDASNVTRNNLQFPEDNSIFSKESQENFPYNFNSFISLPIKNDGLSSEEIEEDNRNRYFVNINKNRKTELETKNKTINKSNSLFRSDQSLPIFKISKVTNKDKGKKYVGRKRKIPLRRDDIRSIHDRYATDNIKTFIQNKVMNSILQFVNVIVSVPDLGLENIATFKKIKYSIKRVVNKKKFEENKKKTIGDLLEDEISPKYKTFSSDSNKKEYEKMKSNEIINAILSQKYIDYFKEIFYKNKRTIDLSKFGLKKIIFLSKVVLYEDILKGKKKDDEKYRIRVEEVIKSKFLI